MDETGVLTDRARLTAVAAWDGEHPDLKRRLHEVAGVKVLHRVATHSQWSGDEPTPEDLIRHLEKPLQFRVLLPHMEVRSIGLQIGPHLYAQTPVVRRKEMTMESMAETAGLKAEARSGRPSGGRRTRIKAGAEL